MHANRDQQIDPPFVGKILYFSSIVYTLIITGGFGVGRIRTNPLVDHKAQLLFENRRLHKPLKFVFWPLVSYSYK